MSGSRTHTGSLTCTRETSSNWPDPVYIKILNRFCKSRMPPNQSMHRTLTFSDTWYQSWDGQNSVTREGSAVQEDPELKPPH